MKKWTIEQLTSAEKLAKLKTDWPEMEKHMGETVDMDKARIAMGRTSERISTAIARNSQRSCAYGRRRSKVYRFEHGTVFFGNLR